jgi:hypothetical protein
MHDFIDEMIAVNLNIQLTIKHEIKREQKNEIEKKESIKCNQILK